MHILLCQETRDIHRLNPVTAEEIPGHLHLLPYTLRRKLIHVETLHKLQGNGTAPLLLQGVE